LKELEEEFSEKEIQSYRKTFFGSPAGGQTRLSDTHLKMLAAFGSICLDNQMDLGNAGDKELFTEALVYRHLNRTHHPSILEMISFGRLPKNDTGLSGNYLVLEYAERGSLNDWLEQRSRLCLQEAILFGIQLASGLDFILSRAVLHRDFKMNNILVMKNGKLKITDFGSAASLKNHKNNSSPPGNPDALPPEYGLDHPKQSKFDCWALGFILLEFVTSPKDKLNLRRLKDEIDLLKNTFREAYKTKNRFLIRNAERAILDFITMGDIEIAIHGIETYMLDEFYAGEKAILVQYINIALGLLKPNPAVRTSAVKAHQQLKFLMSHYEF
jgi:serine/threonine protein kinase